MLVYVMQLEVPSAVCLSPLNACEPSIEKRLRQEDAAPLIDG
jgi:hypothetical protein